jgi:hypothetical protein
VCAIIGLVRCIGSLALVMLLALGGCTGGADERAAPIVFTAEQADRYSEAYESCSSSSPEELVVEKDARSTQPEAIATAYALVYEQKLRLPIFQGCLDALKGRPSSPR